MKKLLILRHAQALGTEIGGSDKTRKLSTNGVADAKALGALMVKANLKPDLVLCSGAVRTRETLDGVIEAIGDVRVNYDDGLYNADFGRLLDGIHAVGDGDVETLLLVAHNPGVHALAARMAADDGSAAVDRLSMGYAPATLTVLECDVDDWAQVKPYENVVKAVHETSEYNADERPTRWM